MKFLSVFLLFLAPSFIDPFPSSSKTGEIPEKYRKMVDKGLSWLVKHQHKNGHWADSKKNHTVALTSLAAIALGMEGSTYSQGKYADNIKKAIAWVLQQSYKEKPFDGLIGDPGNPDCMLEHAYALLFLSGAWGEIEDGKVRNQVKEVLLRAVRFCAETQTAKGGWLNKPGIADYEKIDRFFTVILLNGLQEAFNSGIPVPKELRNKGYACLKNMTIEDHGKVFSTGRLDFFNKEDRLPWIVGALWTLSNNEGFRDPLVKKWSKYCRQAIPLGGRPTVDKEEIVHYYYAKIAFRLGDTGWEKMFPESAKEGQLTWSGYRQARFDFLLTSQEKDGSWKDSHFGFGPVFTTALHLTVLQLDNSPFPISR